MDVEGRNTAILAHQFPALSFRTQAERFKPLPADDADNTLTVYLIRNILWNCSDEDCIKIFQKFIPTMIESPNTVLLVNEMLSPAAGTFERHVEKGYRRREVTVMAMHNAKQRTEEEWKALLAKASLSFTVGATTHSSYQKARFTEEYGSSKSKKRLHLTVTEAFGRCILCLADLIRTVQGIDP